MSSHSLESIQEETSAYNELHIPAWLRLERVKPHPKTPNQTILPSRIITAPVGERSRKMEKGPTQAPVLFSPEGLLGKLLLSVL